MSSKLAVSGGSFVPVGDVTARNYQQKVASVLDVPEARAAVIAAKYPPDEYDPPTAAVGALVGDADFASTAFQLDKWFAKRVPTFAYDFNDDAALTRFPPALDPPVATHGSELAYLFDLPDALVQDPSAPKQEELAATMRVAWASFAATGGPSSTVCAGLRSTTVSM